MPFEKKTFHRAAQLHQEGLLSQAEPLYRTLLRESPTHVPTLYLLGTLCFQTGKLAEAAKLLGEAVRLEPQHPEANNNLGLVLESAGELDSAVLCYKKAVNTKPDYRDALFNLGGVQLKKKNFSSAAEYYRLVINLKANDAPSYEQLALALRELDRLTEALSAVNRGLEINPNSSTGWNIRGAIEKLQGKFAHAEASFRQAVELDPGFAEARSNLGVTLAHLGQFNQAELECRQAALDKPENATAHHNLALVLYFQDRFQESAEACLKALAYRPDFADAFVNLGNAFHALRDEAQAERAYTMALDIVPEHPTAWGNVAGVFDQTGAADKAEHAFRQMARLDPKNPLWRLRAEMITPLVASSTEEIAGSRQKLLAFLDEFRESRRTFSLEELLHADVRPAFAWQFSGLDERPLREKFAGLWTPSFDREKPKHPTGPIRVGFHVSHGHEWSFMRSIGGLFDLFRLDWTPVIIASKTGIEKIQKTIRNDRVTYLPIVSSVRESAEAILAAKLDLIYYWEIATNAANYWLPFLNVAPIQVTSWGIQVTSGIPSIEYYIGSNLIETSAADEHYTEKLVRLKTMLTYQRRYGMPRTDKSTLSPPWRSGSHVYLCAQHLGKFHPDFDPIFKMILEGDEQGVIVVTAGSTPAALAPLEQRWQKNLGDLARRVFVLPAQVGDDYFHLIKSADVILDPLHFGGVNTTYDALSYNRAIVTWPSSFHRGRYTAGCFQAMNYNETVADSKTEYADKALRLAKDRAYREHVEKEIASRSEVLFESADVASELEEFFVELVETSRQRSPMGNQ